MAAVPSAISPNFSTHQVVRKPVTRSAGGIVVSHNRVASEVGARVLKAGGHAVDAAVATSFAIGVMEPWMNGIGGTGAMLVRNAAADKVTAIDFGARAPAALDPGFYPLLEGSGGDLFGWPKVKDDRNLRGATSAVVPTLVAGMATAHGLFGRQAWRDLLLPARNLAHDGMAVDWHTTLMIARAFKELSEDPGCRSVFLPSEVPPCPAPAATVTTPVRLPNPALARTIEAIAEGGVDVFFKGSIMRALLADLRAAGGVHAEADFAAAAEVRTLAPRTARHGGYTLYAVPELNGGPTVLDALANMQKRWSGSGDGPLGADALAAVATGLKHAWSMRFATMGDSLHIAPQGSTTHINVVDRDGNMVSLTQTLLSLFGSLYLSPSTGILLNNAINWFDPRPGGPNALAPGRRVLANYAPMIMTGADDAVAAGGAGGRKILPAVFQLLVMMANGMNLDDAIHAPRIDVSGGDAVIVDRRLPENVRAALAAEFSIIEAERAVYPYHFTIAGAVRRQGSVNEGGTEPYMPWSEAVAEDEV
jgi:gamma-glutamyltranspeptidase/glutathione hydrolase